MKFFDRKFIVQNLLAQKISRSTVCFFFTACDSNSADFAQATCPSQTQLLSWISWNSYVSTMNLYCITIGVGCKCMHLLLSLNIIKFLIIYTHRPMDFLITPRHRWIYVAIFGVMGVQIFEFFQIVGNIQVSNSPYWQLVFKLSKLKQFHIQYYVIFTIVCIIIWFSV